MGDEQNEERAAPQGQPGPPPIPVQMPSGRHDPERVRWKSPGRKDRSETDTRNTMIDPRVVNVRAEVDAINRGEGIVDRERGRVWLNGRVWGYHTDTGTLFPIAGEGFVAMTQLQYYALRQYAHYNGITEQAEYELSRHPDLTEQDLDVARRVWQMRSGRER